MEDIKKHNKKQFNCQDCGVTFYHRKGLNVHRKIHETKTDSAIVTATEPTRVVESAVKIKTDAAVETQTTPSSSSSLQELLAIYDQNTCKKKGRPVFISDNLFQQLHETSSTHLEWKDLEPDCVYKLISLSSRGDNAVVGKLENREGISFNIVLPNFVVAKLLSFDIRNSSLPLPTIYIKPATSLDEISLVTVAKWTCKKCAVTLNSKQALYRHCKRYCIYSKQTKLGVDIGGTLEKMEQ